jgi:hypothetical protein
MIKVNLPKKINLIISVLILVVIMIITVLRVTGSLEKDDIVKINSKIISSFSKSYFNSVNAVESKKILLFVDFSDFGCVPCSEGVAFICKSLDKDLSLSQKKNVIILIRKRNGSDAYYSWLVEDWRKENSIVFPIIIEKDNFFEQAGINKTSLAILDKDYKVIEYNEFPMQERMMKRILSELMN